MSKNGRLAPAGPTENPSDDKSYDSPLLLLTRLYWMGFGPIFAVLLLIAIARSHVQWLTATDAVYVVILVLMPLARLMEFRMGKAENTTGRPATMSELRNYALTTAASGLGAWLLAKGLSIYLAGQ